MLMKRLLLTLALFGSLLNFNVAWADIKSPYNVNFNTTINTTSPTFQVASGWAHLQGESTSGRNVRYTYHETGGVDNSGYMEVGTQNFKVYDEYEPVYDLLITPKITGSSSIKVKLSDNKGSVEFYQVTMENGVYTKGDKISITTSSLSTSEWTTVSLPKQTNQMIGIRAEYAYLDDFSAESADVILKKELTISRVRSMQGASVNTNADGTFHIGYTVDLANTGEIDIAANDPDFKLYITATVTNDTVATIQVPNALAAQETLSLDIYADVPYKTHKARSEYRVNENITHSSSFGNYIEPIPYEVIYSLNDGATNRVINKEKPINFGTSKTEVTKNLFISNQGAAPMNVEKVEVSEGFTVDIPTPFTVEGNNSQEFHITMLNSAAGDKQGTLTIKGDSVDIAYPLTGIIAKENAWYESFENGIPTNILEGEGWTKAVRNSDKNSTNSSTLKSENPASSPTKLISPLLEVKEGDKLSFSLAKVSAEASLVNIYYSADRKNWTKVRTLSDEAENEEDRLDITNIGTTSSPIYHYKSFKVDNIPAGNVYVAFEAGNIYLDDIAGYKAIEVAHDIAFYSISIPTNARVNSAASASAIIKNLTANDEAADSYKAELYLGDELIATADAPAISSGKTATLEFSFTPHVAGNLNAYIKLSGDNLTSSSDITTISVSEEVAEKEKQIGTITSTGGTTPVYLYYNNSHNESIYTAEQLGLKNGTKITKIIYRGYGSSKTYNTNLGVWLQNTTDATYSEPYTATDEADMTNVFNGTYTYNIGGTAENPVDVISIELAEPFVYTGNNLRIRIKSEANGFTQTYFPFDGNINNQTIMRYADNGINSKAYSAASTPVVYFNVIGEPNTVSGKIVDEDGNPVADADVLLKFNNVEYKTTTDAEGNYSLTVFKDDLTYTFTTTKDGFTPIKETINPTENIEKNVTLKPAKGFFIDEFITPETAKTNNPLSVSVKAINVLATDLKADAYTVTLYVNDEAVATAETKDVKAGEAATFSVTYYPHVADAAAEAKVVIKTKDDEAITKVHNIKIRNEVVEDIVVVGEVTGLQGTNSPLKTGDNHSETQTIYTADLLGLKKGDVITRIAFKGYNNLAAPTVYNVKAYIENTTDENTTTNFVKRDVTEMTELPDVTYVTDELGTSLAPIEKLIINIPDGFVYDGNNIRIALAIDVKYSGTTWESNSHVSGACWARSDDNDISSKNWTSQNTTPVPYLSIATSKKVNGTVTDNENNPVANAQITISDETGHVVYYGTTDEDGNYEVSVVQTQLSYKATITANGYKSKTVDVESLVENPSAEVDAVLEKDTTTGINDITNNKELNDNVYTLSGILVKKAGENKKLKPGIYIINHKKVTIK